MCGRGGQFGQQVVSSELGSSGREENELQWPLFIVPAGSPRSCPMWPFCLWLLEDKTLDNRDPRHPSLN